MLDNFPPTVKCHMQPTYILLENLVSAFIEFSNNSVS